MDYDHHKNEWLNGIIHNLKYICKNCMIYGGNKFPDIYTNENGRIEVLLDDGVSEYVDQGGGGVPDKNARFLQVSSKFTFGFSFSTR